MGEKIYGGNKPSYGVTTAMPGRRWSNVSKYDPLARYLQSLPATTSSVTLTFRQIETIIKDSLPASARTHSAWWANEASPQSRHTQAVWLKAGWETRDVDMRSGRVAFVRTGSTDHGRRLANAAPKTIAPPSQPTTSGPRRRIGLISCTKAKLSWPAPARELYSASDLFRKAAAYCDTHLDGWFVLSAKYGLVEPERELEPYDVTLKTMSSLERRRWGAQVAQQLQQLGDVALEAHAGADYVRPLIEAGVALGEPLRGLAIGQRKRWYLERLP